MAEHVELVEQKTGLKITRLKPELGSFDYYATEHIHKSRKGQVLTGYGYPGSLSRWCTRLKTQTIQRYLKGRDTVNCVGFAVGEERRLIRLLNNSGGDVIRCPLIEDYNFDEVECLQYCYNLGYTWGGLYNYFNRVSCYCCPLQNVTDSLMLKRHYPDLWQKMRANADYIKNRCGADRAAACNFKAGKPFIAIDAKLRGKQEGWDVNEWRARLNMIDGSND